MLAWSAIGQSAIGADYLNNYNLVGPAVGLTDGASTISIDMPLLSAGLSIGSASGILYHSDNLTGNGVALTVADGDVVMTMTLLGSALTQVLASTSIYSLPMPLSGLAQANVTGAGVLNDTQAFAGAALADANGVGSVNMSFTLSGSALMSALTSAGIGSFTELLDTAKYGVGIASHPLGLSPLAGEYGDFAVASAMTSGAAMVSNSIGMSGTAHGQVDGPGALTASLPLSGAAHATVFAQGTFGLVDVQGAALIIASGTGNLMMVVGGVSGQALMDSAATGDITVSVSLSAQALVDTVARATRVRNANSYDLPIGMRRMVDLSLMRSLLDLTPKRRMSDLTTLRTIVGLTNGH